MTSSGVRRAAILFRHQTDNESFMLGMGSNHPDILRWNSAKWQCWKPLYEYDFTYAIDYTELFQRIRAEATYYNGFMDIEHFIHRVKLPYIIRFVEYRGAALGSESYLPRKYVDPDSLKEAMANSKRLLKQLSDTYAADIHTDSSQFTICLN